MQRVACDLERTKSPWLWNNTRARAAGQWFGIRLHAICMSMYANHATQSERERITAHPPIYMHAAQETHACVYSDTNFMRHRRAPRGDGINSIFFLTHVLRLYYYSILSRRCNRAIACASNVISDVRVAPARTTMKPLIESPIGRTARAADQKNDQNQQEIKCDCCTPICDRD